MAHYFGGTRIIIIFLFGAHIAHTSGSDKCTQTLLDSSDRGNSGDCRKYEYTCTDLSEAEFYKFLGTVTTECSRTCKYCNQRTRVYGGRQCTYVRACDLFKKLTVLSSFLNYIAGETLSDFSNLSELQLRNTLITELKHGVFDNLPNLEYLILNDNKINHTDASIFNNLPKILGVHLDDNYLTNFTMENLPSINKLYIKNNRLIRVNLRNLTQLTNLQLDGNLLSNINDSFSGLPNIDIIDLSNNSLQRIDRLDFHGMVNLRYLDLSYNNLTHIDSEAFTNKTQLLSINLSHNLLIILEAKKLDSHLQLHLLDLSYNQLSSIDHDIFVKILPLNDEMCNLYPGLELRLDNNRLRWINMTTINSLSSCVKMVNLSHNLFQGLVKLGSFVHDLDVSHNAIEQLLIGDEVPTNRKCGNADQTIDFSYNLLRTIGPNLFRRFSQLVNLKLHHNRIEKLSYGAFQGLGNLTSLDLSHNSLTLVHPAMFTSVPKLSALILSHNKLKELHMGAFIAQLPQLSIFDIDFNLWSCESLYEMLSPLRVKSKIAVKLRSEDASEHEGNTQTVYGIRCYD